MIITTTPTIEGHTIREYKGLVSGEVVYGMNVFRDIVLTFEQSIKVVDKKQDRKKAEWGYIHNGQHRRVQVVERRYKEGAGFSELYVNLKRDI